MDKLHRIVSILEKTANKIQSDINQPFNQPQFNNYNNPYLQRNRKPSFISKTKNRLKDHFTDDTLDQSSVKDRLKSSIITPVISGATFGGLIGAFGKHNGSRLKNMGHSLLRTGKLGLYAGGATFAASEPLAWGVSKVRQMRDKESTKGITQGDRNISLLTALPANFIGVGKAGSGIMSKVSHYGMTGFSGYSDVKTIGEAYKEASEKRVNKLQDRLNRINNVQSSDKGYRGKLSDNFKFVTLTLEPKHKFGNITRYDIEDALDKLRINPNNKVELVGEPVKNRDGNVVILVKLSRNTDISDLSKHLLALGGVTVSTILSTILAQKYLNRSARNITQNKPTTVNNYIYVDKTQSPVNPINRSNVVDGTIL